MREREKNYEFLSSGNDIFDHVTNTVALKKTVLVVCWFILEIFNDKSFESLYFLVRGSSHL
jgi:hypothetical protein